MSPNISSSEQAKAQIPIHFLEPSEKLAREHFISSKLRKFDDPKYQEIESEEIKKQLLLLNNCLMNISLH